MSVGKRLYRNIVASGLFFGLATVSLTGAEANVVVVAPRNADFSAAPYTITFGSGIDTATYTFSTIPDHDMITLDQVSTGGDGLVSSLLST
ncbi:MAG TPA: hypothetical protein VEH77_00540, partial [Roseiarcus sp.]|nr:hypothetical protein [Roseiarcus sp.]